MRKAVRDVLPCVRYALSPPPPSRRLVAVRDRVNVYIAQKTQQSDSIYVIGQLKIDSPRRPISPPLQIWLTEVCALAAYTDIGRSVQGLPG